MCDIKLGFIYLFFSFIASYFHGVKSVAARGWASVCVAHWLCRGTGSPARARLFNSLLKSLSNEVGAIQI